MYEQKTGNKAEIYPVFLNVRSLKSSPINGEIAMSEYDGVVIEPKKSSNGDTDWMYIVGSPNQIKSATNNVGTFDADDNNIYFNVGDSKNTAAEMSEAAHQSARALGVDVDIIESTDNLTGRRKKAKGWFDPNSGKVTVVLPNHRGEQDIAQTVMHEVVGHYGMRRLMGEKMNAFLGRVFRQAQPEVKTRSYIREHIRKYRQWKSNDTDYSTGE